MTNMLDFHDFSPGFPDSLRVEYVEHDSFGTLKGDYIHLINDDEVLRMDENGNVNYHDGGLTKFLEVSFQEVTNTNYLLFILLGDMWVYLDSYIFNRFLLTPYAGFYTTDEDSLREYLLILSFANYDIVRSIANRKIKDESGTNE